MPEESTWASLPELGSSNEQGCLAEQEVLSSVSFLKEQLVSNEQEAPAKPESLYKRKLQMNSRPSDKPGSSDKRVPSDEQEPSHGKTLC